MALGTIRIQGADTTANNTSGSNWVPAVQFTTAPSFLCKLVVFVPTSIAANRVVWLFDAAVGSGASTDPVAVLVCSSGYTTTLDFGDYGKIFKNGIYIAVSTTEPANPTSTVTAAANNDARVTVDFKIK